MRIVKYDEVFLKVDCESDVAQELAEYFTFFVPGYKFMPAYRNKMWDGKIRLFNPMTRLVYAGVIKHIELFCKEREYELEIDDAYAANEFSLAEAKEYIATLKSPMEARDYQLDAFTYCVRNNRALMVSPTASGKSFIIYLLTRYYNAKTLIIVPTTTLVHQLAKDFISYGYRVEGQDVANKRGDLDKGRDQGSSGLGSDLGHAQGSKRTSRAKGRKEETSEEAIHKIYAGQEKESEVAITITTWQSVYKQSKAWFAKYDVVIGDEAHLFKAKSLTSILGKLDKCKYRFGFTGTLDGTETHKLVLEGLFGPVRNVITTKELMDQGHVSDLKIKAIVLKYRDEIRKAVSKYDYQAEMDYITTNEARNRFIINLTRSLQGTTMVLFQYVDKHGKVLYDTLKDKVDIPVHYVYGGVDGEDREAIRQLVTNANSSIVIASYGTFSTGINIPNIDNVIFASPSKSRIRNLQSIGRGLRKAEGKTHATLFDIADDLSWKSKRNHTLNHFVERIKIYNEQQFEYKIYTVELK
jgi:superfamily II DNA or RNA helicase